MKSYLRKAVFAWLISLWLSTSAYATHGNNQHPDPYGNQQPILVKERPTPVFEHSFDRHPLSDEHWLIGSMLVSLIGLTVVLRIIHRE